MRAGGRQAYGRQDSRTAAVTTLLFTVRFCAKCRRERRGELPTGRPQREETQRRGARSDNGGKTGGQQKPSTGTLALGVGALSRPGPYHRTDGRTGGGGRDVTPVPAEGGAATAIGNNGLRAFSLVKFWRETGRRRVTTPGADPRQWFPAPLRRAPGL